MVFVGLALSAAGAQAPWPAPVPGFVPPKPGEHPRLFFRRGDLPRLRERAKTPEGKAIVRRLMECLGSDGLFMPQVKNDMISAYGKGGGPKPRKKDWPVGTYSMTHAAGFGFLYQLTGDKGYADLGKECFEWAFEGVRDRDREARYSWKQPGGALRAGPSIGWYAVGYDLCYDGWDEAFRKKVALAIQNYDEGKNMSLAELARGSRHMPASNHWGMQVGGAALALLAIRDDPGIDTAKIDKLLEVNSKAMIRNMTEGFGDHGWFPEGDGTGSMSSHIVFLPALQAWRVAGGRDFVTPRPHAQWMTLKWLFLTVFRDGRPDCPKRGAYPHNVWDRDGISGAGYFTHGFGTLPEPRRAALLWLYNRHLRDRDAKAGTPFDTPSPYPHHAILSFVNWPSGLKERNPAEVVPRAVRDEKFGFYMFRNRWRDENDIVLSIQTRSTRGWHKANTRGDIEIWAFGRKERWGRVSGDVTYWHPAADGSAILAGKDGTHLAVDFSGASGADALLVMTGKGAGKGPTIEAGGIRYVCKLLAKGSTPVPRARGDKLVIGEQTVCMVDGRLTLGRMRGPWAAAP